MGTETFSGFHFPAIYIFDQYIRVYGYIPNRESQTYIIN